MIRAGSKTYNKGGKTSKIVEVIMHEKWSKPPNKHANDIALLKMENPFELTDQLSVINLPGKNQEFKQGTKVRVSGWGVTKGGGEETKIPVNLLAATINIMNMKKCQDNNGKYGLPVDPDIQICAGLEKGGKGNIF